jgi:PPP family 3-phenylpropionic acid transporter
MPVINRSTPYWRLSSYYFFYFATLGAIVPYWGLYLQHRGFSAVEIGELLAIIAATKIIAPYLWGWIADHSGRGLLLIRLSAFAAIISFAGVYVADGLWLMALVMLLFSFFWNANLPQFEATTLHFLGEESNRYSHIRLWGSIGFIMLVISLGPLLDHSGLEVLPHCLLLLYTGIWIATLWVPNIDRPEKHQKPKQSIIKTLKQRPVIAALATCFLMQLSFGAYYAFFSIYLEQQGYTKSGVGTLWALGAGAEIFVFLAMYRLLPKFGARWLMCFAFAATAMRWWSISQFVDVVWIIALTQLLHAFGFGMFHATMIHLIHRHSPSAHKGRGQALYSSLSFGAGGALGAFISGFILQYYGGSAVFLSAGFIALIGLLVAWFGLPVDNKPEEKSDTVDTWDERS